MADARSSSLRITPFPLALIVCDNVWRDPYTGKCTILGTFSSIGGPAFPLFHPVLTVYAAITDGRGLIPVKLQLIDANDEDTPLFEHTSEIDFTDPRIVGELIFQQVGFQFPRPSEYRLQLFANEEFIMERRIAVFQIPELGQQEASR